MDKVDYILRDQHFIFAPDRRKAATINPGALIDKAMIVQNRTSGTSQIAFFMEPFIAADDRQRVPRARCDAP